MIARFQCKSECGGILGGLENLWRERHIPARKRLTMDYWICFECLEKYEVAESHDHESKLGICPMCLEYRNLIKAEPLKETGKQGGNYAIATESNQNQDR